MSERLDVENDIRLRACIGTMSENHISRLDVGNDIVPTILKNIQYDVTSYCVRMFFNTLSSDETNPAKCKLQ